MWIDFMIGYLVIGAVFSLWVFISVFRKEEVPFVIDAEDLPFFLVELTVGFVVVGLIWPFGFASWVEKNNE